MNLIFRSGNANDISDLTALGIKAWAKFEQQMSAENWAKLYNNIASDNTYKALLDQSDSLLCVTEAGDIIGMAFLVPQGNPTDIYDASWSYIRFVSVHPDYAGKGIGRALTIKCIELAKTNGDKTIALHTSEFMANARHIYESLGFTILKEIDQRFGKRYWLYTLDLSALDAEQ